MNIAGDQHHWGEGATRLGHCGRPVVRRSGLTDMDRTPRSSLAIIDLAGRQSQDVSTTGPVEGDLLEALVLLRAVSVSVDRVCAHDCDIPAALELFNASHAIHRALSALEQPARTIPGPADFPAPANPPRMTSKPRRPVTIHHPAHHIGGHPVADARASTVACLSEGAAATLPCEPAAPSSPFGNNRQARGFAVEWQPVASGESGPKMAPDRPGRSAVKWGEPNPARHDLGDGTRLVAECEAFISGAYRRSSPGAGPARSGLGVDQAARPRGPRGHRAVGGDRLRRHAGGTHVVHRRPPPRGDTAARRLPRVRAARQPDPPRIVVCRQCRPSTPQRSGRPGPSAQLCARRTGPGIVESPREGVEPT